MSVSEQLRLQALRELELLDSESEKEFDDITKIAAIACDTPVSMISLVDDKRQWFKATYGMKMLETPRDIAFCSHAIERPDELMEVKNTLEDDRFKNNPLVNAEPNMRFYAGMPLVTENGYAIGTVCVIDGEPKQLTPDQKLVLQLLSKQTMRLIYWRLAKRNLKANHCYNDNKLKELLPLL